jgi:hypothetical protein
MNRKLLEIFIGLLAIFAGLAGAWYGKTTYLKNISLVSLPVPKADIEPYTLLSPDLFQMEDFPSALVEGHQGYAQTLGELSGRISTTRLLAGLPVPIRQAETPGIFRLADPGLEVLSLPVAPENIVGGQVRVGEKVNLYRTNAWTELEEDSSSQKPVEKGEVNWIATVPVVAVLAKDGAQTGEQTQGSENSRTPPVQILVVAALPETAARILEAQALTQVGNNQLWVTLAEIPSLK